jgi:two-component system chemotaxis response regulator CheB
MRAAGSVTIAQDEMTSVVWGMPGEAVKRGAAEHVLALDRVVAKLMELVHAEARGTAGSRSPAH